MAESDIIKGTDLIEKGYLKDATKEAKELAETIDILTKAFSELIKEQKEGLANIKKIGNTSDAKSLKETANELKNVTEARKAAQKVEADLAKAKILHAKQFEAQRKAELADFQKQQKNSDEYIKAQAVQALVDKARIARLKAIAIEQSNQIGLEQKLLATNARLRLDRAALTGAESDYKEQLKAINDQLDKNNELIKENSDKQKQQALTVGDYKNQIKEALAETTGFGKVISKVSGFVNAFEETLRAQKVALAEDALATTGDTVAHQANIAAIKAEEAATQKLSLAKRALNAITSPVGLIILAVAAVAALAKAAYDVNQAIQDSVELGIANSKALATQNDVYVRLAVAVIAYRKELGNLELQLQELNDIAGDQAEIAADETLALGLRKKALDEAAKFRIKAAEKELEIATKAKEITDLELERAEANPLVGKGKALQEFRDKQVEAQKKLFDASDKLGDLERTNAQEERKFTIQQITDEIELIRSKKLGADSAVETLKKQVADETTILSNRRAAFAKLEAEQKKAQEEEIALLTKFGLSKKEIDSLIAETDAVKLARELKSYGQQEKNFRLSVGQTEELAKVVLEAQKNKLDRTEQQNKLDEKAIENQKTLVDLNNQLIKAKNESELLSIDEEIKNSEVAREKAKQASQSSSRLFSKKREEEALKAIQKTEDLKDKAAERAQKNEDIRYFNEVKKINDAVAEKKKEKEIADKELEILEEEHQKRIGEISDKYQAIESEKTDFLAKKQLDKTVATLNQIEQVTVAFEQELAKRNALEQKNLDRSISQQEKNISTQERLAEQGKANTLAFEKQKLEEQQLARRDAEEKAAKEAEALQLAQQFNGFLQAALKETPTPTGAEAIMKATKDTFLARGIAKGLVQFAAEGNNMIEGEGTTTSDSIPFMLSKKEAVIKASENIKHNDAVVDLNAGVFGQNWMPKADIGKVLESSNSTAQNIAQSIFIQQNNEIKDLLLKIADKPVQQVNVDQLGNLIETVYKDGIKKVTTHINKRRL